MGMPIFVYDMYIGKVPQVNANYDLVKKKILKEVVVDVNKIMTEFLQLSAHMHESAFCSIWFGANPHGIHGVTPTDLMHAFLHGIVLYVIKILLSQFAESTCLTT